MVADLYAGYHDRSFRRPYTSNTLQLVFSSSKFVEGLVVAYLVDLKLLEYGTRIGQIWPEFAQGKSKISF